MDSILTVTDAAASVELATLDAVKTEIGISGTGSDTQLSGLLTDSSRIIASYCRRTFGKETVSQTFRQTRAWMTNAVYPEELRLSRFPLVSVTSVTEDSNDPLLSTDYEADFTKGILYRLDVNDARARWTASKIVIPYVAGYRLPNDQAAAGVEDLPDDIQRACVMLVKLLWFGRKRDPLLKDEEVAGIGRSTYFVRGEQDKSLMPLEITSLLDPYRAEFV